MASSPPWPPPSASAVAATTTPVAVVQGVYVNASDNNIHYHNHNINARTPIIANTTTGSVKQMVVTDNYYSNAENGQQQQQQQQQRPRQQQHRCNDFLFAILFVVHLVFMAGVVSHYVPTMVSEIIASNNNSNNNRNLISSIWTDGVGEQQELVVRSSSHRFLDGADDENDTYYFLTTWLNSRMPEAVPRYYPSTFSNHNYRNIRNDANNYHRRAQQQQQQGEDGSYDNYYYDSISGTDDMVDLMLLLGVSAVISLVLSTGALTFMISCAESLIKFALLFNIVATAVFAVGSLFLSPFAALMGLFLLVMTVYYAYVVWGRIPFAASNLVTASTAVRFHLCGLATLAYMSLFIVTGWTLWWTATFVSTVYVTSGCDGNGNCAGETSLWLVFALLLSYHWVFQVIKNVVHVTVAGTVGTWWFVPSADATGEKDEGGTSSSASRCGCCSSAVGGSYLRSMTTSFGSICMGSLLVAIVEAAKNTVRSLRESEDGGGIFLCLAECLLACLQDVLEYFNMWAFVFVGLYGFPFIQSGKSVMELFKSRGWTTIITDQLAEGALGLVSVAVGLLTGLVALGIAAGRGMVFGDELGASAAAFFIGFITGSVLTSTLLTLVSSAVSTVIVCYAEAPGEFERNHPKLSQDMRSAWRQAWPEEFQY